MQDETEKSKVIPPPSYPIPDPNPPIDCGKLRVEPNTEGAVKCPKCGFWHQLEEGIGEAIGETKFGE